MSTLPQLLGFRNCREICTVNCHFACSWETLCCKKGMKLRLREWPDLSRIPWPWRETTEELFRLSLNLWCLRKPSSLVNGFGDGSCEVLVFQGGGGWLIVRIFDVVWRWRLRVGEATIQAFHDVFNDIRRFTDFLVRSLFGYMREFCAVFGGSLCFNLSFH